MMLEVTDLASRYGHVTALSGIDLRIDRGELVALVGANGAGKTTLLRVLSGVHPAVSGTVRFQGEDISGAAPNRRVRAGIVQVPEGRQVFAPLSVEDNLVLGAYLRPQAELAASLERAYTLFPVLREKRAQPAGMLSGGQQQMLAMGRALMGAPKLLLLDEPSMGLAPKLVAEIFAAVRALRTAGVTILLVDQNARATLAIADRGYVLDTGSIVLEGAGSELLNDARVKSAYLGV